MTLELKGITKRFPGVLANEDVSLSVAPGEVVALLGENGAGKTTLMNVLYGLYRPDAGTVAIDGQDIEFQSSRDAIAAGIGMVHQHFMLVPVFSVAENVILGLEPSGPLGIIDEDAARAIVRDISERYRLQVDPDAIIEDLPVGIQQRVEIIKVLNREARFVIFDEPTAVLTPQEVEEFFAIVRGLRADGKGIIFITHKLGEALELADRVVVLRGGKKVAERVANELDEQECADLMVGRPVELVVPKNLAAPGDAVLTVKDLNATPCCATCCAVPRCAGVTGRFAPPAPTRWRRRGKHQRAHRGGTNNKAGARAARCHETGSPGRDFGNAPSGGAKSGIDSAAKLNRSRRFCP